MEAYELRADTSQLLKNHCPHNKANISREEHQAIIRLRDDHPRVVLTVDKGMAIVVLGKEDYMDKALSLLSDTSTYKTIHKDPTTMLRNTLITKLMDIKQQGGLSDITCRKVYQTYAVPLSSMAFPKSIK